MGERPQEVLIRTRGFHLFLITPHTAPPVRHNSGRPNVLYKIFSPSRNSGHRRKSTFFCTYDIQYVVRTVHRVRMSARQELFTINYPEGLFYEDENLGDPISNLQFPVTHHEQKNENLGDLDQSPVFSFPSSSSFFVSHNLNSTCRFVRVSYRTLKLISFPRILKLVSRFLLTFTNWCRSLFIHLNCTMHLSLYIFTVVLCLAAGLW
jgi:hypothetical protein